MLKLATMAATAMLAACKTTAPNPRASVPPCAHPVPVENHFDPALPSVLVSVRTGANLTAIAARLGDQYAIDTRVLAPVHLLVVSPVTEALVEQLRCEPDIERLSYDVRTYIG